MRTSKFRPKLKTDKQIYTVIMEIKSIIDTIAEEKSLESDHDLCRASDHLDWFLDALEKQFEITGQK